MKFLLTIFAVCCTLSQLINGHGYILNPPGRSTAWRAGFSTPANYDDNGLNCGGYNKQHNTNGGKCGVCGDDYSSTNKQQEPGPGNKYATGTIVATYNAGQYITIKSTLTAYHKGYFEIKLCQNNIPQIGTDASVAVTQSCFDVNLLKASNGDTRITAVPGTNIFTVKLPEGVTCEACVLQWRYRAGNNWGQEYVDGELVSGLGYGSQEEFINCADVKIISSGAEITNLNHSTTLKPTTDKIQTAGKSTLSAILSTTAKKTRCYDKKSEFNAWCTNNCALGNCNPDYCWCDDNPVLPTKKVCEGVHKVWCENNCNHIPSYCPASHCTCQDVQFDPRV